MFFAGICLYLWLSVCNTITCENLDVESSLLVCEYVLRGYVSGSYTCTKIIFPQRKTFIGKNSGSTEDRAVKSACSMVLTFDYSFTHWWRACAGQRCSTKVSAAVHNWNNELVADWHITTQLGRYRRRSLQLLWPRPSGTFVCRRHTHITTTTDTLL